jgi:ribosomal protein S8
MSLVNLAHVCSHIQNASKARLGITSIPVSKLHARLMIELQKQGFIQSVVLGGPSPPLPYKLRPAPEYSAEETRKDFIQRNPWAAFPEPEARTLLRLQKLQGQAVSETETEAEASSGSDRPSPSILGELQNESDGNELPEDYYEEEEEDEQSLEALAASLSQAKIKESALTRPQPGPLQRLEKRKRIRVDINHNVDKQNRVPANPARRRLWLTLKYWNSEPVLSKMSLISKPTKRIWLNHKDIDRVVRGRTTKQVKGLLSPGECIFITTDRGILEARECVERRVGGTILCRVS